MDRILTERRGHILVVTINRPEARNAFDSVSAQAMHAAMDLLDAEDELFVGVITGTGGVFSAGADLKAVARGERAVTARGVDAIAAEKVNMSLMVPTMIDFVDRHLQANPVDVSSLRKLIYGASPISEALLRRAMKSLPNVQFFQGYGQTEMAGGVVTLRPEFHAVEGPNARLLRAADDVANAAAGALVAIFVPSQRAVIGTIDINGRGVDISSETRAA